MILAVIGIKTVMFLGFLLLLVLLAGSLSKPRPDRPARDKFFSRLAKHGLPKGGPYIPFPPEDYSNS